MNVSGLSTYTYQSTLQQTGSASQALSQALTASKSQADLVGSLFGSTGTQDPLTGAFASPDLASLTYTTSAAAGSGSDLLQSLLAGSGSSLAGLFSSGGQSLTSAMVSPSAAAALARFAYDQSQNPATLTQQATASAQQSLLQSGLSLLA